MFRNRFIGLANLRAWCNVVLAFVLFWIYYFLYFATFRGHFPQSTSYLLYYAMAAVGLLFDYLWHRGSYVDPLAIVRPYWNYQLSLRQAFSAFFALLLYLAAAQSTEISRIFLFTYVVLLWVVLNVVNRYLPSWLYGLLYPSSKRLKAVALGSGKEFDRAMSWLSHSSHYGFEVIGTLSNSRGEAPPGLKLLGNVSEMRDVIENNGVNMVLHAGLAPDYREMRQMQESCDATGARFVVSFSLNHSRRRPISIWHEHGLHLLSLREEPLECPLNQIVKRVLDVLISLPVVFLLLPIMGILIIVVQCFQSPGPLLFRQNRTGLKGGIFRIWKFRTMHVRKGNESVQASKDDARIYPFGRWLRQHSLDELPQFINVLLGEMSVVGPRPHLPEHDHLFAHVTNDYRVRTWIKPGVTGLAQVRGFRGETPDGRSVIRRVRSDLHYLENWTVGLDLMIILRTATQIVKAPKSAV